LEELQSMINDLVGKAKAWEVIIEMEFEKDPEFCMNAISVLGMIIACCLLSIIICLVSPNA
jgi:hypothetical protein